MKLPTHLFVGLLFLSGFSVRAAENTIDFVETFTLADDRAEALKQLVPGTEDYYYYHALHAQNEARYADVENYLEPWKQRHGESQRYLEIRHRQALLRYPEQPAASLEYLKREFGLRFNHQQRQLDAKPDFPTELDPDAVSWAAFFREARGGRTLQQLTESGLDYLLRSDTELSETTRRELLSRLKFPDYPRLVGLVAADLRSKESRGFGEFEIHRQLLPDQLDSLEKLVPHLEHNQAFINTRLTKLAPSEDVDWRHDRDERGAYIQRLWDYTSALPVAYNSLKAHTLYRLLDHQRREGNYPIELFREYIEIPRQTSYRLDGPQGNRGVMADLNADFSEHTSLPPIRSDEELVRDFLLRIFENANSYDAWELFIRESFLKPLFAEAKLTKGKGDAERWFSLLTPAAVQQLKNRIDLEFSLTNESDLAPDEAVTLELDIKNVDRLMVKVYELNPLNYYLSEKREINTDLNLDGLIANSEKTYEYEEASIRQVRRTFTFEELANQRGIFVIEFIGNGQSSRALIRKGELQYLAHTTAAGIAITVLNKDNTRAENPAVWHNNREYRPDKKTGVIILPFSSGEATSNSIILTADNNAFASLDNLNVPAENYGLSAAFSLVQESLLPGKEATLGITPTVSVNQETTTAEILSDVTLTLESTDENGIASSETVPDFELFDDRESTHTFRVPEGLRALKATLSASVSRTASAGEPYKLRATRSFQVNSINQTQNISDLHLSQIDGNWHIEYLGKTGEPLADRAVHVSFIHESFTQSIQRSLKSAANGRIALGALSGLQTVTASAGAITREWKLSRDSHSQSHQVNQAVGVPIQLAVSEVEKLTHDQFAIFEVRNGTLVRDVTANAKLKGGIITITDLTPGDYVARNRAVDSTTTIRVTAATEQLNGYALSKHRHLEVVNAAPLQIASIDAGEELAIKLANADEFTRVRLAATNFIPRFDYSPGVLANPETINRGLAESLYLSGRDIGDEYRYILERRDAKKFPGNGLGRPSLILNPWVIDDTRTDTQLARDGEAYDKSKDAMKSDRSAVSEAEMARRSKREPQSAQTSPDYTFLANQAPVVFNLAPDENGLITLPREILGDRQFVTVTAINENNVATRMLSLPEDPPTAIRDLRLRVPLDVTKHFTQQQRVTALKPGESLTIPDLRASELATYDSLSSVYAAMLAMNPDETLAEFRFLVEWPSLDEAGKRETYSKYASHELNFFLSRRDEDFFQTVIQPYLANKRDKTFMDDYLIQADLTRYLESWAFGRLNILEKILLAKRLGGDRVTTMQRFVRESQALKPVVPADNYAYFLGALRGRGMSGGGENFGMAGGTLAFQRGAGSLGMVATAESVAADSFGDPFAAPAPVAAAAPIAVAGNLKTQDQVMSRQAILDVADGRSMMELRQQVQQNYQKLESTKEWAENNYYHVPIAEQVGEFLTVNPFWFDYATWNGEGGFYSRHFPAATSKFSEIALALAVLDLPFEAEKPETTIEENSLTLTAKSPTLIFHQELEAAAPADGDSPVLISQNFARANDRYRYSDSGERSDKFVTEEFLSGELYLNQIVVTNPTSSSQRLALLLQIPQGAIPAGGSEYVETQHLQLGAFSTQTREVFFYFPMTSVEGKSFAHYPTHVSRDGTPIAWTDAATFNVVEKLSTIDKTSWDYLSQFGSEDEVIGYLETNNLQRTDLTQIAWRVRESEAFFNRVIALLDTQHVYDDALWSYGLFHDALPVTRQYLLHQEGFLARCGLALESPLVSIDPVDRAWYQHLEYQPLVNARAHQLGRDRTILNDKFHQQYHQGMKLVSYRSKLSAYDAAGVAYYLFLQDRVEEALAWLDRVEAANVATDLQLDYLNAYAALYRSEPEKADEIAAKYVDYPVNRWRERFAAVRAQVAEIGGAAAGPQDEADRDQKMAQLAELDPSFEVSSEGQSVTVTYRNLDEVVVNYYEMALEFLFSTDPFVANDSGRFQFIRPNESTKLELEDGANTQSFELPEAFASANVLVEIVAAGQRKTTAVYANQLDVTISENYGRLSVRDEDAGKPLSTTYVKVYARFKDGTTRFFKDGYTDLRGKFDYTSLNTDELDQVETFSLLIMSEKKGAMVKEVAPPGR